MARSLQVVRTAVAQATTGQTDVVAVPGSARRATIFINLTAVAGTTPLFDCKLQYRDPVASTVVDSQWNGITQATAATLAVVHIGGDWDTEDDTAPIYFLKDPLPQEFNIVTTLDRTTGDETYSYTITVEFSD